MGATAGKTSRAGTEMKQKEWQVMAKGKKMLVVNFEEAAGKRAEAVGIG